MNVKRRGFLVRALGGTVGAGLLSTADTLAQANSSSPPSEPDALSGFPQQAAKLVRETVGASHAQLERVRELVIAYPELAKASWDWGFGDWESPIEAASHTGQREIVRFLLEHGARPNLFTHVMLGELEVVKAILTAQPEQRKLIGPHGLTLLHHARVGGERAASVFEYLQTLDGTDPVGSKPTKELAEAIVGEYRTSEEQGATLVVEQAKQGLTIRGNSGVPRILYALSDGSLHPAGAPSVRMKFEVNDGRAGAVTIALGGKMLVAKRVG